MGTLDKGGNPSIPHGRIDVLLYLLKIAPIYAKEKWVYD
jgi:hypothetical protein